MSQKFQVSGLPTAFAVDGSSGGAGATGHFYWLLSFFAITINIKRRQIRNPFIKFENSRVRSVKIEVSLAVEKNVKIHRIPERRN